MPFLLLLGSTLLGLARTYLPGIVGRILLALGIGVFTTTVAAPALMSMVQGYVSGIGSFLLAYFGALGFDKVVSMVISVHAALAAHKVLFARAKP